MYAKKSDNINATANSTEKFMTYSIGDIMFIHSLQFMASSLETLANNLLPNSKHDEHEKYNNMKNILIQRS